MNYESIYINEQVEQGGFIRGKMALLCDLNFINAIFCSVLRYRVAQNSALNPPKRPT